MNPQPNALGLKPLDNRLVNPHPEEIYESLYAAIPNDLRNQLEETVGKWAAETGFRFSKDYRHLSSEAHAVVYALFSTVGANITAERFNQSN